jgi:hypothetical protein
MKLTSVTFLALIIIAIIGCNDDTVGPGTSDNWHRDGDFIVYVVDDKGIPVDEALVNICCVAPYPMCSWESTNAVGATPSHFFTIDEAFPMMAIIKKQGYVPTVDTFTVEPIPLNNIVIIMPRDSGYIEGWIIVEVQDTGGHPLVSASILWKWYPGVAWKEPLTDFNDTEADGRTTQRLFLIDSTRNYIIVNAELSGYESACDTLAIISDSTQEILFKLEPE